MVRVGVRWWFGRRLLLRHPMRVGWRTAVRTQPWAFSLWVDSVHLMCRRIANPSAPAGSRTKRIVYRSVLRPGPVLVSRTRSSEQRQHPVEANDQFEWEGFRVTRWNGEHAGDGPLPFSTISNVRTNLPRRSTRTAIMCRTKDSLRGGPRSRLPWLRYGFWLAGRWKRRN